MIQQNFYSLFFFLFVLINSQEISKKCVCGHVRSQTQCENSSFCIWQNEVCVLNPARSYFEEDQNESVCSKLAVADCKVEKQCEFYFGKCIGMVDCTLFHKDQCQQSSFRCISDGAKCVKILECDNYKTEIGCANKNQNGRYCFWIQQMEKKCRDVVICEELPKYLVNHVMCKQGLDGCTVNEQGQGCIKQKDSCTQYLNDFQCFESKQRSENCFWDSKNNKCFEKICENLLFSQDYECRSLLSECTSNGIHCIQRKQCSDAQNKFGCVTDAQGNKCEYHKNQCIIKSCGTALESFTNYQQCQDYDNLLDCVTSENGGCKQRPQTCQGYIGQVDCYSIEQQDCIWYNNKCEKRECYHAPLYYSQADCQQYGNCIGKVDGGCEQTPNTCDEILLEQFCELNYNKQSCIWLEGKCTLLECNKLKFPTYNNHSTCQKVSSLCTFNLEAMGCAEYQCENIYESEFCLVDSTGRVCTMNQGCIDKKCNKAPPNYQSNQQCEEWLPYCTVNVQSRSNYNILIGCVDKKNGCDVFLEEQCYTTFSGINCKWDSINKMCLYQVCTDADPNQYLTNENCNSFKVLEGTCIIGSSGNGCQLWSNTCGGLISQLLCELNLQDGTKCFWTGSLCKILECSDASVNNYTNNIECNTWLDYCIFNQTLGGCMERPSSVDCTSSPNDSMYDTHFKCQAWNPKCTVISSINSEGCETKKANCTEYIRQRNCKTNLSGKNCYWGDLEQKCYEENDDSDCSKKIYGDLSHQNCENFLQKCTVSSILRTCVSLSLKCDYRLQQQCVITINQQPCKWDQRNQLCKDVMCSDNITAQTEAECLNFRKLGQCQLKIQTNGSYGPGCESRPTKCSEVTNSFICKLTLTQNNQRCYYYSNRCQIITDTQCQVIKDSNSNELCQLYNDNCILLSNGLGCYSFSSCSDLSKDVCNSAIITSNQKCNYQYSCRPDTYCSEKSYWSCQDKKTGFGQLCQFYLKANICYVQTVQKYLDFNKSKQVSDKNKQCQDYSSNYIYDTQYKYCKYLTSCDQQYGDYQLCNSSTTISSYNVIQRCGYNFTTNTCENRRCEHLTYANYPVITDQICFDWKSNCVLDVVGCITYSTNCTLIKLIYQCYQENCYWQDGKCVNHVDCQINTVAVTNHECLLVNAQYCRLNYTKGLGCAFFNCSDIKDQTICNSSNLVDGQNCKWIGGTCSNRSCNEYILQSECESSYGKQNQATTKCFWCSIYPINCSNNKYCNLSTISPKSHQDCNDVNSLQTISFTPSAICIIKKSSCSEYTYQDACVSTLSDEDCYWSGTLCQNKCEAITTNPTTNQQCYDWNSNCILNGYSCSFLNCSLLSANLECNIYITKCFWDGSTCKTIGDCSLYSTSALCSNSSNSKGILCFWNSTQCQEKTCSNIPNTPSSDADCNNWLTNCQFNTNNNSCVEDCTSADNSYITHDQCESYYANKSCTVKLDIIQCVDLPISCGLAKETQCYLDRSGHQCSYQKSTQTCVILTCSNLDTNFTSHEQCNEKLKECTVNSTLNGCQQLNDCNSYSIQEQCYFDQNNIKCEWIMSQNKCTIKECSTAQFNQYTAYGCHQYFGDSCTVNQNLDGCEIGQTYCKNYNSQQCISDGQMNLSRVDCFWNEEKSMCQERICENGPSNTSQNSECISFLSTCQKGSCRKKECFDYYYDNDSACASTFEDKRCATNGNQCVLRMKCENVTIINGCTFDNNLNPCVWIDEKCITKTCQTAQVSLTKYEQCNSYLPYCTVKQDGGCTRKQSCQNYQIKEACQKDREDFECIWDINISKCFSNQCINFCGDGIVSSQDEQCDDGNYLPYDGCYQCEYQCSLGCIQCEKDNHCVLCESQSFYLDTQTFQCKVIVSQDEQKPEEDQNQQIQCGQNKAIINNECITLCGNGVLDSNFEQCDDGNSNGGDGCSSLCIEEDSYKCINQENRLSSCTFIQQPNFNLVLLSDRQNQTKILELSFSQEVYLQAGLPFESIVEFAIFPETQFGLSVVPLKNITSQLSNPHYQITVQFYSPVTDPIIQINIQQNSILNQYDLDLYTHKKEILLGTPLVLSLATQERTNQVIYMNDAIIYTTASISGLLLLTGNQIVFFNLLDLLQTLSYIRYMQYRFPPHLRQFLETYTKVSLTPILDRLKVDEFIAKLNGGVLPNLQTKSSQQSQTSVLNQFYLINAKGCYLSYIVSIITYILCCLISSNNISSCLGRVYQKNYENFRILKFIQKVQKNILQICQQLKIYYFSFGVFQLFYSTLHQQLFSTLLQFPYYNFSSPFEIINSIAALGSQIVLGKILLKLLSITTSQIKDKQKWKYFFQDSKTSFWAANYKPFQIYKTVFYITILIEFIRYPEAQSILLSMQSLFFLIYLVLFRPIASNFEQAKLICREVILLITTGSFLVYSLELNDEQYMLCGWLHIGLFCFLIASTLVVDIFEQVQKAYYIYLKKAQTLERMKVLRYYDNPLQKFIEIRNLDMKVKK